MKLHVVSHPLVDDVLAALRDKRTPSAEFRRLAHRVSLLVAAEATRDLPTAAAEVETPLETTTARRLARRVVAVPVLRAGLGMLDAFLELVPTAQVGYFGLERNEQTAVARRYYEKVPKDLAGRDRLPARPDARDRRLGGDGDRGPARARRPARAPALRRRRPGGRRLPRGGPAEAEVYTAALDRELNDHKYILPGLGDFGDRLFGT